MLGLACAAVAFLLVLAVVVAPWMNVSRFRRRIAQSISAGIGRPVHIGSVSFQLLPQPAFVLNNFSVAEDPAFGAEPVLTADTVTAMLRPSSLWHWRVEIATLSLDNPSLNLTRNANGQWDFDSVLQRTSAQSAARSQPFPYVEASSARINFKFGAEKQPFSLLDADLALWKEPAGNWHIRVKAQPVRTDLDLSDTGELRMEVVLGNASTLGAAPLLAHVDWSKVPLGAMDRLARGSDSGWRGMADTSADLHGTLTTMDILTRTHLEDFHRAEVVPGQELNGDLQCSAHYARAQAQISAIACQAPLDSGAMQLHGAISLHTQPTGMARSQLQMTFRNVPASFLLSAYEHVHPGLSAQVAVTGEVNGQVECGGALGAPSRPCTGALHATRWSLLLPGAARPLVLPSFDLTRADLTRANKATAPAKSSVLGWLKKKFKSAGSQVKAEEDSGVNSRWVLSPVSLALGASAPATITGTVGFSGYTVSIAGPAALDSLMPLSRELGDAAFPVRVQSANGSALLALTLQGHWVPLPATGVVAAGASTTAWKGTVQLRPSMIALENWPGKIQLASAMLHLAPNAVLWDNVHGSYQKEIFDGSLQSVTDTATNPVAPVHTFHLHVQTLNPGQMERTILDSSSKSSLLIALVNRWKSSHPALPALSGQVLADHLILGTLNIEHAALAVQMGGQKAAASSITGEVLGGKLSGSGSAEWTTGTPVFHGKFDLRGIKPNSVAALFPAENAAAADASDEDVRVRNWGRGTVNLHLEGTTQGLTARSLAEHTVAQFHARWKQGGWSDAALATTPLAAFSQLTLQGEVQHQTVQIQHGELSAAAAHASVSGTVTFPGQVNLALLPGAIHVMGTLAHPMTNGKMTVPTVADEAAK